MIPTESRDDPGADQPASPGACAENLAQADAPIDGECLVQENGHGQPAIDAEDQDKEVGGIERRRLDVGHEWPAKSYIRIPQGQATREDRLAEEGLVEEMHPHEIVAREKIRGLDEEPGGRECRGEERAD